MPPRRDSLTFGISKRTGLKIRIASWIAREHKKRQKEGQEDQGTLEQRGASPIAWCEWPRGVVAKRDGL